MKWPMVKLGDICEPKQWPTLAKSNAQTGDVPVYGANGRIGWTKTPTHTRPTILIGCRGSCGTVHLMPAGGYANGNAMALDFLNESKIDIIFLKQFLEFRGFLDVVTGSSQPQIIRSNIVRVEIPLPPLDEQKRIAAILDKADALRRKRRQALALLDGLAQGLLNEFIKIGNYPIRTLGSICKRITDGTHQSPTWTPSGVPFLFVSNINNHKISFETTKFISTHDYERLTKSTPIEIGDVLYTAVGSYGRAAEVDSEFRFIFQRHIAHIKPDLSLIRSKYLSYLLESPDLLQQADNVARGVAQKTVTLASLREFLIPLPPLDQQEKIEASISSVEGIVKKNQNELQRLDALFASLQHRAFHGEL